MTLDFNVTNKVVDDEQRQRYDQGVVEFGVQSPMFYPLAIAAIINLAAFFGGFFQITEGANLDRVLVQMFISGFAVLNSIPIYEAMALRTDNGRIPTKTTAIAIFLVTKTQSTNETSSTATGKHNPQKKGKKKPKNREQKQIARLYRKLLEHRSGNKMSQKNNSI
jgi:hypothetical protein